MTDAFIKGLHDPLLSTRALTNRTNLLYTGHRWIEALNHYENAVKIEPQNGVASSAIVKIAIQKMKLGSMAPDITRHLVTRYFPSFCNSKEFSSRLIGNEALAVIVDELKNIGANTVGKRTFKTLKTRLTKYERFCFNNRFFVTPFLPREFFDLEKSDDFRLARYIQGHSPINADATQIFLAEIIGCFKVARFNCFQYYIKTASQINFLLAAQKLCFDILDKIAVAIWSILDDKKIELRKVYFRTLWFGKQGNNSNFETINDPYKTELENGNYGLIALIELSYDIFFGLNNNGKFKNFGYLTEKHKIRNSSTHQFVSTSKIDLPAFKVLPIKSLEQEVSETLFLVKSAIGYFIEFIYWRNTHLIEQVNK